MIAKIFTSFGLASSNILLYHFLMQLEVLPGYKLLFILIRAVFITSILMQTLVACGFFRGQKIWTWK